MGEQGNEAGKGASGNKSQSNGQTAPTAPTNANQPAMSQAPVETGQEPLKQAIEFIKSMKEKGKANRSMQDEARYKQAIQLVSQSKANPLH